MRGRNDPLDFNGNWTTCPFLRFLLSAQRFLSSDRVLSVSPVLNGSQELLAQPISMSMEGVIKSHFCSTTDSMTHFGNLLLTVAAYNSHICMSYKCSVRIASELADPS